MDEYARPEFPTICWKSQELRPPPSAAVQHCHAQRSRVPPGVAHTEKA